MPTHTLIRPLAAAALTTSVLALAACGDGSAAGEQPSASREAQMQEAQIKFARCMRDHGIEMGDPKPGQRGVQIAVPKGVSPEKAKAANEACKKYLDAIKPPELSEEQQKEAREAALAFSRCMREHGVDFPDPTFGENGQATIRMSPGSGPDLNDPKVQKAQTACQSKMPQLGGDGPETSEAKP
jgi:hypothetical protein